MKISTDDIVDRIRARYPAQDGWVLDTEVNVGVGRRADVVLLNVWASKRWCIIFEIKTNVTDFRRELDDPTKRAPAMGASNEFYYAAPHGVVPIDELPDDCGLMEALAGDAQRLRIKKRAKQRKMPDGPPQALVWALMNRYRKVQDVAAQKSSIPAYRLAGKDLSLAQFEQLSIKYWEMACGRRLDQMVTDRHNKQRLARRAEASKRTVDWAEVIPEVVRLARRRMGVTWPNDVTTEQLVSWLRELSGVPPMARAAELLRGLLTEVEAASVHESMFIGDDLE